MDTDNAERWRLFREERAVAEARELRIQEATLAARRQFQTLPMNLWLPILHAEVATAAVFE